MTRRRTPNKTEKLSIDSAILEAEDHGMDVIICKTCSNVASEEHAPYCCPCFMYWEDVKNGLFDDRW